MPSDTPFLKLTYEDHLLFPDDGRRHELLDGEHCVTPAPNTRHQAVSLNLSAALKVFLDGHPVGRLLTAPTDVVLSDVDVVQPDVLFVSAGRLDRITKRNVQGPPDLVVEILSETTRRIDEVAKRKLYDRYGVEEYWIVDPELETIKIYRRAEKGFERAAELSKEASDALSTPLLPGLSIPLSVVFA